MGMDLDRQTRFSLDQAITASAGSTDQIDLITAQQNLGRGKDIYFNVVCTVAMTDSSSNSTVTVTLETDNDSAFGSATTAQLSLPVFSALSAIGTARSAKIQSLATLERYMRAYYTVANGNLDTGSFTAWLGTTPVASWTAHPNGYDV